MQQQVMVKEYVRKHNQTCHAKVGSKAKNILPARMNDSMDSMDVIGLSWIFADETKAMEAI